MKDIVDIEKVYDEISSGLYNTSLRIVGCSSDAEEIMHDTLLQYWRFRHKDEIRDLRSWLAKVCIRKSIDKLRERHRRNVFLENYDGYPEEQDMVVDRSYDIDDIQRALASLPDQYRAILSMRLFDGYDYQEISQITGSKESTIRSLYMRGRFKLAEAIKKNAKK